MRNDYTDITLVVDRSGSMTSIRDDAEGGVNHFIATQALGRGENRVTLVQFDTVSEIVVQGLPASGVPSYRLVPRGMTALLDAVGEAIDSTGKRLAEMPEESRPGLVVFVIVTDGRENCSQKYDKRSIRRMIRHQQGKYSWQFTFLAANQDAFREGGSLGIDAAGIATFEHQLVSAAYRATADKVRRMREAAFDGAVVDNRFTAIEQNAMVSPD